MESRQNLSKAPPMLKGGKALKEDKRAIFRAASEAHKVANFVLAATGKSGKAAA